MALILAVNPGGSQNAALARLARELPGHELIGADSCAVAIGAVDRRAPDLVLFPPLPGSDKADLIARLRAVPGGVRMLDLPSLPADKPRLLGDFAARVRESLAGPSLIPLDRIDKARANLHLIAAGAALAGWVRARRATWTTVAATPAIEAREEAWRTADAELDESEEPIPDSDIEIAPGIWEQWREPILLWLPRVGALAVVAALAAVTLAYLPNLRTRFTSGELVLESGPAGSQVFIDGRLIGTTPTSVQLPAGQHRLEFRNGTMSRTKDIAVAARGRAIERVDWMDTATGSLLVRSTPSGARVLVDGTPRGNTPLTLRSIAVGSHEVTIESAAGSVRRAVTIAEGKTAGLTESIFAGWFALFSPIELEISEGSRLVRTDDRGRATLPAGPHLLRFRNRQLGYDEVRTVEINPGETTALNLSPQTTISITATEPSEVSIDGARVGRTPVAKLRINLGSRVIVVKPDTGQERKLNVTVTAKPVQINVDFSAP